jgi:hypothetical protein
LYSIVPDVDAATTGKLVAINEKRMSLLTSAATTLLEGDWLTGTSIPDSLVFDKAFGEFRRNCGAGNSAENSTDLRSILWFSPLNYRVPEILTSVSKVVRCCHAVQSYRVSRPRSAQTFNPNNRSCSNMA